MSGLTLLCVAVVAATPSAWSATGVTSIELESSVLTTLGVEIEVSATAAPQLAGQIGFAASEPGELRFEAPGGDFEGFAGGELRHSGTLVLRFDGRRLVLSDFILRPAADPRELELFDTAGRRYLRFEAAQPYLRDGEWHLQNIDVALAPELAQALGRPELTGTYLGHAHIRLPAPDDSPTVQPAGVVPCAEEFTPDRDVSLEQLGIVSQLVREPGGRVALTLSAVLRNAGTSAILWREAIEPDGPPENVGEHPYLALHLYRLQGTRLKQIGRADVKHAFFSVNQNCPCAPGHVIYAGCEDVYGAFTNADRFHLGPREEVTLSTGEWTRLGSHFDGAPVNDFRDHLGDSAHDDFEHRLVAQEADLQEPGEFFVEGWYVIRDDIDLFNSMGNYPVLPALGAGWTFGPASAITRGSILERLVAAVGSAATTRVGLRDTGVGRLQLAVVTTDLGGGQYHHEYALMNFDYDRRVGAFEIELDDGVNPTSIEFVDVDREPANDWSVATVNRSLTWTAPPGNEQDWGTLFSFAFDSNAQTPDTRVTVFAAEAGSPASHEIALPDAVDGGPGDANGSGGSSGSFALGPAFVLLTLAAFVASRRKRRTG